MGWEKLFRRKLVDHNEVKTELHRVLSTFDLTLLGIGSTLGTGIYVLAGDVAKTAAGPAVVISFLVAALASVLAGLCYAEFGARVPKAGSAYVYSYVCVGEVIAFVVGWNLIMEYVIGVASVSKAYSGYVDSIIPNNAMSDAFKSVGTIHVSFLANYFDFFAFGITVVLTLLLMFGVKESTLFNNIFTVLNLLVVLFVIIAGAIHANADYWEIDSENPIPCKNITESRTEEQEPGDVGVGGFTPFGIAGIMTGAATCFYGFIGFDVIATTGEEAKNPKRAIPISIVLSLLFIFLAYFGISTVLTMMVPYYCQDKQAPLPYAFRYTGFSAGKWVVNVGALFGLATSLLGSMFPMPRIIYSMAKDGLLFKFLAYVHPYFQTPMWATLIGGFLGAIMGALFELSSLIDMMSIGTLTAYTLVALCVLILRYRKDENGADDIVHAAPEQPITPGRFFAQAFNIGGARVPTRLSSVYTLVVSVVYCIFCFALCGTIIVAEKRGGLNTVDIILIAVFAVIMLALLISMQLQPISRLKINFTVPLVPWVPAASILVNTYLILELPWQTWARFAIWMAIGLVIYIICLCTGLADRAYDSLAAEYETNLQRANRKPSLNGIDNPALDFVEELETRKPTKDINDESKPSKTEKSPLIEPENVRKVNGTALAKDEIEQPAQEAVEGVTAKAENELPKIVITEEPLAKDADATDGHIKTAEDDPEVLRKEAERVVDLIVEAAEAHATTEPLSPLEPVSPEDYNKEAEQFVESIVEAAEAQAISSQGLNTPPLSPEECRKDAEQLVDSILEAATAHTESPAVDPVPLPPFLNRPATNDFQNRVHFALDSDLDATQTPTTPSDPTLHAHEVCQDVLSNKTPKLKPNLSSPEELKAIREAVKAVPMATPTPEAPSQSRPAEFVAKIQEIHQKASELLAPVYSIEKIHAICQKALQTVYPGTYQVCTLSPSMRAETQSLNREVLANAKSDEQPIQTAKNSEKLIDGTLEIHEAAQKLLAPKNPLELIHRVCQACLDNANNNNEKPVLTSRSAREELKKLVQSLLQSQTGTPSVSEQQSMAAEVSQKTRQIHNEAQEVLKVGEKSPEVPVANGSAVESLKLIHEISQLCLNGVNVESVPWLDPILTSQEEIEAIKQLNRRMTEGAVAEQNSDPDPVPLPPHVVRQQQQDLQRIHAIAQAALSNFIPIPAVNSDPEDYAVPQIQPKSEASTNLISTTPESIRDSYTLSPAAKTEPIYAKVNKKPKHTQVSVTFNDKTEMLPTPSPSPSPQVQQLTTRQKLMQRRPTGIFRGNLMDLNDDDDEGEDEEDKKEGGSAGEDQSDEDESYESLGNEAATATATEESENSGNFHTADEGPTEPAQSDETTKEPPEEAPAVVEPRRRSVQKNVGNLISMFENAAAR